MVGYAASRLARMVLTVWLIATLVFIAVRLSGNPLDYIMPEGLDAQSRQAMIAYFGLDRPLLEQYGRFFHALYDGEFGLGLVERRPVTTIFAERVGPSLRLMLASLTVTILLGVPLGVLAAIRRRGPVGSAILAVAFIGYAVPNFVLSILFLLIFSFSLHWLPSSGNVSVAHHVMPTAALTAFFLASLVRYTRSAMLDVLSQDFMRTARAKGLSERVVVLRHGLRNALIPVITVVGLQTTSLVSGAVVIESIFAWHGVGDLLVGATLRRDYPVLQFGVLVVSTAVVLINVVVDFLYAVADPRVRLARS